MCIAMDGCTTTRRANRHTIPGFENLIPYFFFERPTFLISANTYFITSCSLLGDERLEDVEARTLGVKNRNSLLCLAKGAVITQLLSAGGTGGLGLRARLVLFLSKLNGSRAPMSHCRVTRSGLGKRWWSVLHLRMVALCCGDPMVRSRFLYSTDGSYGIFLFLSLISDCCVSLLWD